VKDAILADLRQSRPVILVMEDDSEQPTAPLRWALIDGVDAEGGRKWKRPRNPSAHNSHAVPGTLHYGRMWNFYPKLLMFNFLWF